MSDTSHRTFIKFNSYSFDMDKRAKNNFNFEEINKLLKYLKENIIGIDSKFLSPFGSRKIEYCDYTASGKSVHFIENYILNEVLPNYGSTHTSTSVTALQTSLFRHESKEIIRNATYASEHDKVIYIGSGATSAVNHLIHVLQPHNDAVVFVDPFAHHSSLLSWRENVATVVRVKESADGNIDMQHLEEQLVQYKKANAFLIGCFTAASNVTGIIVDDVAITVMLHKYGALAFWDYATAAPYVDICINPVEKCEYSAHKDAVFFSMHKFVGGVQTPGVLIVKEHILRNSVPTESGGGTVFFVSRNSHRYLKDAEEREEGGTPSIVESIRAGLVMQLKMNLTPQFIMMRNKELARQLYSFAYSQSHLLPLGNNSPEMHRLPILSFVVKHHKSGKLLHHNFVSAVLNDLFGIQGRGGCACAGPYAQDLLGIEEVLAMQYESILKEEFRLDRSHLRRREESSSLEVLRPGFVRINLPFTADQKQIDFILSSLQLVSEHGWRLLPQYHFTPSTGHWQHYSSDSLLQHRQWLQRITYNNGFFSSNVKPTPKEAPSREDVLQKAQDVFKNAYKVASKVKPAEDKLLFTEAQHLMWFLLPSEAFEYLKEEQGIEGMETSKRGLFMPFMPCEYPLKEQRPLFVWRNVITERNVMQKLKNNDSGAENNLRDEQNSLSEATTTLQSESNEFSVNNLCNSLNKFCLNKTNNTCENTTIYNKNTNSPESNNTCIVGCTHLSTPPTPIDKPIKNKWKWHPPTKHIYNLALQAINQFSMLRPNDKVLVCVSGGKDSLSLLHTMHQLQFAFKAKGVNFVLGAMTIDPGSTAYNPRPLVHYMKALYVPYFYEEQDIIQQAEQMQEQEGQEVNSICSFCSRMKRGRMYACARREGYNVLALGQHIDDLAESFVMSVFHNGRLRTMKASYTVKEGDLRVIRPFAFIREKELRSFAETRKLPIIPENCPGCFDAPKERHRVKQLLAHQEVLFPNLYFSLQTALMPLLAINKTGLENQMLGKGGAWIGGGEGDKGSVGKAEEEEDL